MHGPQPGAVEVAPTSPTTNGTVTAAPSGFSDPDGDALTYEYQWNVDGTAISGATGESFDLSAAGHGDRGDVVSVDVAARDPKGHVSTGVNDSVTVVNHAPVKGSVAIDPSSPPAGTALTATPAGFSDADGDELTYIYAWFRNDEAIDGDDQHAARVDLRRGRRHPRRGPRRGWPAPASSRSDGQNRRQAAYRGSAPITTPPAPPVASPDRTAPKIVVAGPKARKYKVGQTLRVKVSGTDDSGFAGAHRPHEAAGSRAR